jgi:hypothetical protein
VSLIERSIGGIGVTGGVLPREQVVGSILISRLEPKELVIVESRPRIRTRIIKRISNNNNKYSSIIRSKVILIA